MGKQTNIEKNTAADKAAALSHAVSTSFGRGAYSYLTDYDDNYVYFVHNSYENEDPSKTMRTTYQYSDGVATVSEDAEEVVKLTEYKKVEESMEKSLTERVTEAVIKAIDKNFGATNNEHNIIKQFNEEKMIAVEKLYIHPDDVDGVGDTISQEDTVEMVKSLNMAIEEGTLQTGLFHKHRTDAFEITKAWVAEEDCKMGETFIKKGQPLIEVQFKNEKAWELRKSGKLAGISIGARARDVEELDKSLQDELKKTRKAKRILKGVHFQFKGAEVTYTDWSQGGACSLENDMVIAKAKVIKEEDLSKEQKKLLEEIGEDFTALEKSVNKNSPSSSEGSDGEENNEEGKDEMSQDILKELEALRHENKVIKVEKALSGYGLSDEVTSELADTVAKLDTDGQQVVSKALDALVAQHNEKVEKEVEKAKAEASSKESESDLAKALDEEAGESGESETVTEKSFLDELNKYQ